MSIKTLLCVTVATVTVFCADTAFGQRANVSVNQAMRYLGGGHSWGYQWRTPGPKVGYYNPYSYHNTHMITGVVPQGAGSFMARLGCCGDGGSYSSFDDSSSLGGYQEVTNGPAPIHTPSSNVIESEVDVEKSTNMNDVGTQPSPSDQPATTPADIDETDGTSLWPGFNQLQLSNRKASASPYPVHNRRRSLLRGFQQR